MMDMFGPGPKRGPVEIRRLTLPEVISSDDLTAPDGLGAQSAEDRDGCGLTDLLIQGPETLHIAKAFSTPPFAASDFEGFVAEPPRIAGRIQSINNLGNRQFLVALQITNSGAGIGHNIQLRQITLRALSGPAGATIALISPTTPFAIRDLSPGASEVAYLTVSVPAGVTIS